AALGLVEVGIEHPQAAEGPVPDGHIVRACSQSFAAGDPVPSIGEALVPAVVKQRPERRVRRTPLGFKLFIAKGHNLFLSVIDYGDSEPPRFGVRFFAGVKDERRRPGAAWSSLFDLN